MKKQKRINDSMTGARASRAAAATYGVIVGSAGIMHGIFEILQGNATPDGVLTAAIGPAQRFWEYGTLHALALLPSYLWMGVASLILGAAVVIWSVRFVHTRFGAPVLLLLTVLLFLSGGGFAPIFVSLLGVLIASRIQKPLTGLRVLLPEGALGFLGSLWSGSLVLFVLLFAVSVEIAVFGWPLTAFIDPEVVAQSHLNTLSFLMLGMLIVSTLTVLAHDAGAHGQS
jgi:hypothetical protein